MTEDTYNASQLIYEMMQHETMGVPARTAMRTFSTHICLHSFSASRKTFTFRLVPTKSSSNESFGVAFLTLQVIKGSLHTLIWSTFARFDDEYALFFHLNDDDIYNNPGNAYLVWSVKGVDSVNSKISAGLIDWFILRRIQAILRITSIGVLAFAKILGRFLLSIPNFIKLRKYLPPMPATFMFNYLMVVCYSPFELRISTLSRLLNLGTDYTTGFHMKHLLRTLIQPNGSGSWLLGYLPVRVTGGGYVLQSKYYFQQGDAFADVATGEEAAASNAADTNSYSKQCARLMMESAVRVVELLPHPLGRRELVVVLEFVHNNQWSANTRFVSLDAFQVSQAIQLAGQPPPQFLSKIEIIDKLEWAERVRDHEASTTLLSGAVLLGGALGPLHPVSSIDPHSTPLHSQSAHSPLGSPAIGSLSTFSSPVPTNFAAQTLLPLGLSSGDDGGSGAGIVPTVSLDAYDESEALRVRSRSTLSNGDTNNEFKESAVDGLHGSSNSFREKGALLTSSMTSSDSSSRVSSDEHDSADFIIENVHTTKTDRAGATSKKRKAIPPRSANTHQQEHSVSSNGNNSAVGSHGGSGRKKNYVDFVDFENSCEWGAPYLLKRHVNFYAELMKELIQPTAVTSSDDQVK